MGDETTLQARLAREHRHLAQRLLELQVEFEDTEDPLSLQLDQLRRELSHHDLEEERVLFPFLEAHGLPPADTETLRREHRALERLLMDAANAFDDGTRRLARGLLQHYALALVDHHAHEERALARCTATLEESGAVASMMHLPG